MKPKRVSKKDFDSVLMKLVKSPAVAKADVKVKRKGKGRLSIIIPPSTQK